MTDRVLQISRCTSGGGVRNAQLSNWSVSFDELGAFLSKPAVGDKDGTYFVRGAVNATGKRGDANISLADLVVLDGDSRIVAGSAEAVEGAPPPELVHEVLRDLDIQHLLYTSHSHGPKGDRYRVLIVPDRPLTNKNELALCVDWLIHSLHAKGVMLNDVKENRAWSQPWYFPRVRDAQAPFRFLVHDGGELLAVDTCLAAAAVAAAKAPAAASKVIAAAKPSVPLPASPAPTPIATAIRPIAMLPTTADSLSDAERQSLETLLASAPGVQDTVQTTFPDDAGPIALYIAKHGKPNAILDLLTERGYVLTVTTQINGHPAFRLKAPKGTSGSSGVIVFQTQRGVWRAYSHHGDHDPLSHRAEDAFGLLRIFVYGGDLDAALEHIGVFRRTLSRDDVRRAKLETESGRALVAAYASQRKLAFNLKYGMLLLEGKAVIVSREVNENTKCIQTKFASKEAIQAYYGNDKLPSVIKSENDDKWVIDWGESVFHEWLTSPYRRSYPQAVFAPEAKLAATTKMPESEKPYNLFIGTCLVPQPGDCMMILDHICSIWCRENPQVFDYVIKWLARMVQQPAEQGKTVIVLRSGEGTGKNIIIDIFGRYFGEHSVMLTKPEDLAGFNDHLGLAVFVFLNEALWGGNKSVEGTMKSTITDDVLLVERKYLPKFKCRNSTHIIVATNNDWAVPVGIDDRRFLILDASEERKGDFTYFSQLADHIQSGGQEAFLHYLENLSLEGFDVRAIPQLNSVTKLDHKIRTADSITKWWIDILVEGGFVVERQTENDNGTPCRKEVFVSWEKEEGLSIIRQEVFDCYRSGTPGTHKETMTTLMKKITELLGLDKLREMRPWNGGEDRQRMIVLPSLNEARLAMEAKLRQRGPWHDEESD